MKRRSVLILFALLICIVCVMALSACDEKNDPTLDARENNDSANENNSNDDTHHHFYDYWVIEKEATCKDVGSKYALCDCGNKITEEIPLSTTHSFQGGTCKVCGELKPSEGLMSIVNDDGTCSISRIGTCTDTEIRIPKEIDGRKVTGIEFAAFEWCTSVTSIIIPDTVTKIGAYAFQDCSSLERINIPDSVTEIGNYAFMACSSLTSITIPNGVKKLNYGIFTGCSNLKSITIPKSVTVIDDYAFAVCSKLTTITFQGTKSEWNAIVKVENWNYDMGDYTVRCSNGNITE